MDWLQSNWVWLIVIISFVAVHMFGHGHGHGRKRHEHSREPDQANNSASDRNASGDRARPPSARR